MRSLKLSRLERALIRKLYARRYSLAALTRLFRCCEATIKRAIRNIMDDDLDGDDALVHNSELPADLSVMLGLKERDGASPIPSPRRSRWRPYVPAQGHLRPRTPLQPLPRLDAPSPKIEPTESDISSPRPVVRAKVEEGSTVSTLSRPKLSDLASVEGLLASIQLGNDHAQMLLDEGIKTHRDLLHLKDILGTEFLRPVKDALKARGFTTFELIKFLSAVKGIPA